MSKYTFIGKWKNLDNSNIDFWYFLFLIVNSKGNILIVLRLLCRKKRRETCIKVIIKTLKITFICVTLMFLFLTLSKCLCTRIDLHTVSIWQSTCPIPNFTESCFCSALYRIAVFYCRKLWYISLDTGNLYHLYHTILHCFALASIIKHFQFE